MSGGLSLLKHFRSSEWPLLVGRVFLPVFDKISKVGSIGIAIKIVVYGVRNAPDDKTRLLLGGAIFMAFGIAGAIQLAAEAVRERMETLIDALVERLITDPASAEAEAADSKKAIRFERGLGKGLRAAIGFTSSAALIIVLVLIVGWFEPAIGISVLVLGALLVNGMRLRRQKAGRKPKAKTLAAGQPDPDEDPLDPESLATQTAGLTRPYSGQKRRKSKRIRKIRIGLISNILGALVMAASFLLLTRDQGLDEEKIAWIVVFCLGMRLLIAEGAVAIRWWLEALDQKHVLMEAVIRSKRQHA